jgi:hypothetical protein
VTRSERDPAGYAPATLMRYLRSPDTSIDTSEP